MGRKCAVPHCYTGYRKCTDKASLYRVPDEDYFLSKWQEAIAREDRPLTPRDYVCEKHFTKDDILRKRIIKDVVEEYQRPKLKPDAIPSIFPDLPEYILKMTKKRRKLTSIITPNQTTDISSIEIDKNILFKIKNEPDVDIQGCENKVEAEISTDEIDIKTEVEEVSCYAEEELIEEYDSSGAKLYLCEECNYKTKFSHNLRTHKIKHLSGDNAFMSCEVCINFKTKWEVTYVNHMKSKHGIVLKTNWKCPFCPFKTKNKNFLSKHCDTEHKTKINCDYESGDCETDIHNVSSKKTKQYFNCSKCPYRSHSQALLDKHLIKHLIASNKNVSCKKSQYPTTCEITLNNHQKNTFHCVECPFTSSIESDYLNHTNTHSVSSTSPPSIKNKITLDEEKTPVQEFSLVIVKEEHVDEFAVDT